MAGKKPPNKKTPRKSPPAEPPDRVRKSKYESRHFVDTHHLRFRNYRDCKHVAKYKKGDKKITVFRPLQPSEVKPYFFELADAEHRNGKFTCPVCVKKELPTKAKARKKRYTIQHLTAHGLNFHSPASAEPLARRQQLNFFCLRCIRKQKKKKADELAMTGFLTWTEIFNHLRAEHGPHAKPIQWRIPAARAHEFIFEGPDVSTPNNTPVTSDDDGGG